MSSEKEKIIAKIKKLLAVNEAAGATRDEAINAAIIAQKLIAEHGIGPEDLIDGKPREIVEEEIPFGKSIGYCKALAAVVAKNFRCLSYINKQRGYTGHRCERKVERDISVTFVGYDIDVAAAINIYEYLRDVGLRLAGAAVRRYRGRGVKGAYLRGFIFGVNAELEKQCEALLLVTPMEVEQYIEGMGMTDDKKKWRREAVGEEAWEEAWEDGCDAGRGSIRERRLETARKLPCAEVA
jgi:hypothetical protein